MGRSTSTSSWGVAVADLIVTMGHERVGRLDGSDPRSLVFTYDDAWVEDPRATPLSVSLPVRPGPYGHAALVPYLWGLLPDNERVLARWARDYQCSANDVFALLGNVGADVAGAARYLPDEGANPEADGRSSDPLSTEDVEELLRQVREDATAWHAGSDRRWSLAGVQAKIALAYDERSARWVLPHGSAPTTHILKPAIDGLDDHDVNEHLCLATAGRLGLQVAETTISTFGEERALVVRRYDRVAGPDGSFTRVHQEDFCQALGVHPSQKYQSDGGPGFADMVAIIRATTPGDDQVERLCLAVAYNWLVLGTDAHAKNCSLLLSGPQVRLAPLYDVASAAPSTDWAAKEKLAQKIGGEYVVGRIGRRHLERLAVDAGVDRDRFLASVGDLASGDPRRHG